MHEIDRIIEAAKRVKRGILATVVATSGSTYRRPGARSVISEDGDAVCTISGGCLGKDLAARCGGWLPGMKTPRGPHHSSRRGEPAFCPCPRCPRLIARHRLAVGCGPS